MHSLTSVSQEACHLHNKKMEPEQLGILLHMCPTACKVYEQIQL